jgi:hypothetical protein
MYNILVQIFQDKKKKMLREHKKSRTLIHQTRTLQTNEELPCNEITQRNKSCMVLGGGGSSSSSSSSNSSSSSSK